MALKNLFDMVKADRYTADGREAIIKAMKAETEDKVYQIGEISEKTGLQKTAQGWKPPKETKFGKVQQKNGEWGVQTKTGKGSSFIKHKDEADAKRALANYTAGYNRAGRNKEDPHSDKARQIKHWNKETDQIAKKYREERRAAHAEAAKKGNAERQDKIEKLRERTFNKTELEGLSKGKLDNLYKSEMESKPSSDKWEETQMASGKIYDTPDRTYRIIERNNWETGEKNFDIRDLNNMRADDIKGIKTLEEAKRIVAEKSNSRDAAPRVLTGDCKIRVRKA